MSEGGVHGGILELLALLWLHLEQGDDRSCVEGGGCVLSTSCLILCSRCWQGSEAAFPGRCTLGARSLRSPSHSAGSKLSPTSAVG